MRTLITGSHGFTGRYLVDRLQGDGREIHGIAQRDGEEHVLDPKFVHVASLHNHKDLRAVIEEVRPDRVVHLAAIAFVAHDNVDEIYKTNLLGTRNLLQALVDTGFTPKMILLVSSANVYGSSLGGTIDESLRPIPGNDYGVSKLAMEYVAQLFSDRLPITIVRPFNYTGVGQSKDFVIPKIVDHFRRRCDRIELGNIDVARDFSDVRSVVDCYARLLDVPEAIGATFNVCSGKAYPLRDVLNIISRLSGHSLDVHVNPRFVRDNEVRMLCGSKVKIERMIGPINMPPIEDTLRWMLEA